MTFLRDVDSQALTIVDEHLRGQADVWQTCTRLFELDAHTNERRRPGGFFEHLVHIAAEVTSNPDVAPATAAWARERYRFVTPVLVGSGAPVA